MTTLESKLSKQKKDATSNMVQEAVQRDIENKEKAAVNEHESDGALESERAPGTQWAPCTGLWGVGLRGPLPMATSVYQAPRAAPDDNQALHNRKGGAVAHPPPLTPICECGVRDFIQFPNIYMFGFSHTCIGLHIFAVCYITLRNITLHCLEHGNLPCPTLPYISLH